MNWFTRHYWFHKLKDSPYQPLFATPMQGEYVSLDCETTSLDPNRAELVTIAATKIIDNRILTSQPFEVRLSAPQSLDSGSVKIHKIRRHLLCTMRVIRSNQTNINQRRKNHSENPHQNPN